MSTKEHTLLFETEEKVKEAIAYRMVRGGYMDDVKTRLREILTLPETRYEYLKYVKPSINVLKRIVELQAVLYQISPKRTNLTSDSLAQVIRDRAPDIDSALEQVQRYTYGTGAALAIPRYDSVEKEVKFEVLPAHKISYQVDGASLLSITILGDGCYRRYFRDGTYCDSADLKGWSELQVNPLGRMSVVLFTLSPLAHGQSSQVEEIEDLLNANLSIGIMEAYHARTSYLRSFRVPTTPAETNALTGKKADIDPNTPISPSHLFVGTLTATQMADETDQYMISIRAEIENICSSRGISAATYFRKIASGDEKSVTDELKNLWLKSRKIFCGPEKKLLNLTLATLNLFESTNYPTDAKWSIDYLEPFTFVDELSALNTLAKGIELGVDCVEDYLARKNPDLTGEALTAKRDANVKSRSVMNNEMREQNQPRKTSDSGQNPETNGASGPPAISKPFQKE
jgi:hypothetical protein